MFCAGVQSTLQVFTDRGSAPCPVRTMTSGAWVQFSVQPDAYGFVSTVRATVRLLFQLEPVSPVQSDGPVAVSGFFDSE